MSALPPVPFDILPTGDVTPAMRQWMGNMLADSIEYNSALLSIVRGNALVDGAMQIHQGAVAPLSVVPTYGAVDMWAVWMSSGTPTAGNIVSATGRSSASLSVAASALTGTGTVTVSFRQRVESLRARDFGGVLTNTASASLVALGGSQACNIAIILRTPTAADNYAATTTIYTGVAKPAPASGVWGTLKWEGIALGDVRNGLEIEVQFQYGAAVPVAIDARLTDVQLVIGQTAPTFVPRLFDEELRAVERYYQKSFPYTTAPAQNGGVTGEYLYQCLRGGAVTNVAYVPFKTRMRSVAPTITFYNPLAANANWRNLSLGVDSGAAFVGGESDSGFYADNPQLAGDSVGNTIAIHWTADARL